MKITVLFVLFLFLGIAQITLGYKSADRPASRCPMMCLMIYDPVCGMQQNASGKWVKRIFSNACVMNATNECEGGNYIPCDSRASGRNSET